MQLFTKVDNRDIATYETFEVSRLFRSDIWFGSGVRLSCVLYPYESSRPCPCCRRCMDKDLSVLDVEMLSRLTVTHLDNLVVFEEENDSSANGYSEQLKRFCRL